MEAVLKSKFLNGWSLFWLISLPISLVMLWASVSADLSQAESVSSMIQLAVRMSVPWLFLSFAASAAHAIFASSFSRWLLRNRKFIGLCFAAAMAWQLFYILWLVGIHTDYYVGEVYALSDVVEGVVGYSLLIAMVLTSFRFGRSRLSPQRWKQLHTLGIYWLWAYAWSVYWWNLFYYADQVPLDYLYYWGGLFAWALRLSAWSKKNWQGGGTSRPAYMIAGALLLLVGLMGTAIGSPWSEWAFNFTDSIAFLAAIDGWAPYFPFVPFYPLLIIMLGAWLFVKSKA